MCGDHGHAFGDRYEHCNAVLNFHQHGYTVSDIDGDLYAHAIDVFDAEYGVC